MLTRQYSAALLLTLNWLETYAVPPTLWECLQRISAKIEASKSLVWFDALWYTHNNEGSTQCLSSQLLQAGSMCSSSHVSSDFGQLSKVEYNLVSLHKPMHCSMPITSALVCVSVVSRLPPSGNGGSLAHAVPLAVDIILGVPPFECGPPDDGDVILLSRHMLWFHLCDPEWQSMHAIVIAWT